MLKRIEIFLIAAIFILITAVILIIYTKQREQEFQTHKTLIQETTVNGAAYAINLQLQEKQRHVRLFANEYSRLFIHLNSFPSDEKTANDIKVRLEQRFPDFFTYTISSNEGVPKLMDIESLVGHACQIDIKNFAINVSKDKHTYQNKVFIHPQPFNYHYDIMAPLYNNGGSSHVFFISFYLTEIVDILKTHEIPGQSLILVRQSDPKLIEVTSKGARDKIKREIRLSDIEKTTVSKNIPGTDWRLLNLADPTYEEKYLKGLWNEVMIILSIVSFTLLIVILLLIKLSENRRKY